MVLLPPARVEFEVDAILPDALTSKLAAALLWNHRCTQIAEPRICQIPRG